MPILRVKLIFAARLRKYRVQVMLLSENSLFSVVLKRKVPRSSSSVVINFPSSDILTVILVVFWLITSKISFFMTPLTLSRSSSISLSQSISVGTCNVISNGSYVCVAEGLTSCVSAFFKANKSARCQDSLRFEITISVPAVSSLCT